jgi:hypothetical protein
MNWTNTSLWFAYELVRMLIFHICLKDFDEAMQSRFHLKLKYDNLGLDTRKCIWMSFLEMATTTVGVANYYPE